MGKKCETLIVFDCHGETRPAICFILEVADFQMRVVTCEDEAINLLDNARLTGETFGGMVINNPYLNVDMIRLVEQVQNIGVDIPLIFVKDSRSLKVIIESLARDNPASRIYHAEPTRVASLLAALMAEKCGADAVTPNAVKTVQ